MYSMLNRQLFVVELQKHNVQLGNYCLKGDVGGLHVLLTQIVCGLFFCGHPESQKGNLLGGWYT